MTSQIKSLLFGICSLSLSHFVIAEPNNLTTLVNNITTVMAQHHYKPAELQQTAYQQIQQQTSILANSLTTQDDFIREYNLLWQNGPFSHVRLMPSAQTAEQLAGYLDTMNVGGKGALLEINDNIAVLTVNTMMGQDTIKQIDEAYEKLTQHPIRALIIDLRRNQGGAFAVKPLVGHLLQSRLDAGMFVSRDWNAAHQGFPTLTQSMESSFWQGWSIRSFWHDVQQQAFTRIAFLPQFPVFNGPVFVLISHHTASAAEMAADALASLDNVTLIGEQTAGQMLSQKMFDVAPGLLLALPIADYYAWHSGRIEGQGVVPDITVAADQAMQTAIDKIPQN